MTGTLQPLDSKFAIVDGRGNPTEYFTRWAQQKQIDIGDSITLADLQAYLTAHKLIPGTGIQLTPDGDINHGVTIHADAQAILDEITATRGAVLYRGLLGWAALLPGTAGLFLQTAGAGADPVWAAAGGGGGGVVPTAKYWRVREIKVAPGAPTVTSGFGFAELKFLDGSGVNLCTGGAGSASSLGGGGAPFSVAAAFDGTVGPAGAGWYSGPDSEGSGKGETPWITYDFAAPVSPVQVSYCGLTSFNWTIPAITAIEYSTDGISFKTLQLINNTTPNTDNVFQTYNLLTA